MNSIQKPENPNWVIGRIGAFVAICVIYTLVAISRLFLDDSDLFRVINEFGEPDLTLWSLREPLYWLPGKFVTSFFGNPWFAIYLYDFIIIAMLAWRFNKFSSSPYWALAIMLSPMFVLGFANIHRQLVALAIWLVICRSIPRGAVFLRLVAGGFCFFIHNSIAIVAIADLLADFANKKKILPACILIFGVSLVVAFLWDVGYEEYFREGTEVGTSVYVYVFWIAGLFVLGNFSGSDRRGNYLLLFGGIASFYFFLVSGGSSGSRLFLAFATVYAFDVADYSQGKLMKSEIKVSEVLFLVFLITPTFLNEFSRSILFFF